MGIKNVDRYNPIPVSGGTGDGVPVEPGGEVAVTQSALPDGAATQATLEAVRALLAGTLNVSQNSSPLPNGAATQATLEALRALIAAGISVNVSNGTLTVSGTVGINNFPATQAVSLASVPTHAVTQSGTWNVTNTTAPASTMTTGPTQIATSTTSATLAASLATRRTVIIYNSGSAELLVAFAATATTTAYTTAVQPKNVLVVPRETWTGAISGILATGTGTAQVSVVS